MNDSAVYINSKVLIAELYNDYNIQSSDFIQRFPIWCANALGYLKIHQAYVDNEIKGDIINNMFQLPDYCRGVDSVIINNVEATLKFSLFDKDSTSTINHIPALSPVGDFNKSDITDVIESPVVKENNVKDKPVYWVSNNWIHTNINHGDIVVRYRAIPYEYDSETNMTFPLIYNDELLKLAIKLYVLKMMLNRGYVHPIQNLKDNNPFTNPALYLEQIRFKVRTSCNKFTKDRREILANINTTMLWK